MKTKEYLAGYDAGKNGPNTTNANFSLFSTKEKMEEWSKGNKDGLKDKPKQQ